MTQPPEPPYETLVVIPTFNEAATIGGVLDTVLPFAARRRARVVVADGGSDDGTAAIAADYARTARHLALLHNPERLQAAGINRAVARYGAGATYLIRLDAHCRYPADFCAALLDEAAATGAESIVVSMVAEGRSLTQRAIAAAQNSRIGNGGSAHRQGAGAGAFVDHGHHALMRLSAFRAVGGYDESFACNEDAELDLRLSKAGYRIWMTARTLIFYMPRRSLGGLFGQYLRYGQGRAKNLVKHRVLPKLRQAALFAVYPALVLAMLTPLHGAFALPALLWGLACLAGGAWIALRQRDARLVLSGVSAAVMHCAWSFGFWSGFWGETLWADPA